MEDEIVVPILRELTVNVGTRHVHKREPIPMRLGPQAVSRPHCKILSWTSIQLSKAKKHQPKVQKRKKGEKKSIEKETQRSTEKRRGGWGDPKLITASSQRTSDLREASCHWRCQFFTARSPQIPLGTAWNQGVHLMEAQPIPISLKFHIPFCQEAVLKDDTPLMWICSLPH